MRRDLPEDCADLWSALAALLAAFGRIEDRLQPDRLSAEADVLEPLATALQARCDPSGIGNTSSSPEKHVLLRAAAQVLQATARFATARVGPHEILKAFQSLRPLARAREILYELIHLPLINAHFLGCSVDDGISMIERTERAQREQPGPRGILHFENQRGKRGGYSVHTGVLQSAAEVAAGHRTARWFRARGRLLLELVARRATLRLYPRRADFPGTHLVVTLSGPGRCRSECDVGSYLRKLERRYGACPAHGNFRWGNLCHAAFYRSAIALYALRPGCGRSSCACKRGWSRSCSGARPACIPGARRPGLDVSRRESPGCGRRAETGRRADHL